MTGKAKGDQRMTPRHHEIADQRADEVEREARDLAKRAPGRELRQLCRLIIESAEAGYVLASDLAAWRRPLDLLDCPEGIVAAMRQYREARKYEMANGGPPRGAPVEWAESRLYSGIAAVFSGWMDRAGLFDAWFAERRLGKWLVAREEMKRLLRLPEELPAPTPEVFLAAAYPQLTPRAAESMLRAWAGAAVIAEPQEDGELLVRLPPQVRAWIMRTAAKFGQIQDLSPQSALYNVLEEFEPQSLDWAAGFVPENDDDDDIPRGLDLRATRQDQLVVRYALLLYPELEPEAAALRILADLRSPPPARLPTQRAADRVLRALCQLAPLSLEDMKMALQNATSPMRGTA